MYFSGERSRVFARFPKRFTFSLIPDTEAISPLWATLSLRTTLTALPLPCVLVSYSCFISPLDSKRLRGGICVWLAPEFLPKHLAQRKPLINIYWRKDRIKVATQRGKLQKPSDLCPVSWQGHTKPSPADDSASASYKFTLEKTLSQCGSLATA